MSPVGSVSVLCLWRTLTNRDSPHLGKTGMPDRVPTQCPKGRESLPKQAACPNQHPTLESPFSAQPYFCLWEIVAAASSWPEVTTSPHSLLATQRKSDIIST